MQAVAIDDRTAIGPEVVDFFQRPLRRLGTLIEGLDDDVLGWTPAPDTTAISNIVLHVLGSTAGTFTIVVAEPVERDRAAEFSTPPLPARELAERRGRRP